MEAVFKTVFYTIVSMLIAEKLTAVPHEIMGLTVIFLMLFAFYEMFNYFKREGRTP